MMWPPPPVTASMMVEEVLVYAGQVGVSLLVYPIWIVWLLLEGIFATIVSVGAAIRKGKRSRRAILITGVDANHPGKNGGDAHDLALSLVREGWVVYAGCRTASGLQALIKEAASSSFSLPASSSSSASASSSQVLQHHHPSSGGELVPLRLDPCCPVTVRGVVCRIAADHPDDGLYCLIHNLDSPQHKPPLVGALEWLQAKEVTKTMEAGYGALVDVTRAFLPLLRKYANHRHKQQPPAPPRIITLTTSLGVRSPSQPCGVPFMGAVLSSSSACHVLASCLRQELRPFHIHVSNVVASGLPLAAADAEQSLVDAWASMENSDKAIVYGGERYGQGAAAVLKKSLPSSQGSQRLLSRVLCHAIEAPTPRPEYNVGGGTVMMRVMSLLPGRLREAALDWLWGERILPYTEEGHHHGGEDDSAAVPKPMGFDQAKARKLEQSINNDSESMVRCRDLYEIVSTIGAGGFAVVKLGVCKKTQDKVALKIIRKDALTGRMALLILAQEMKVLDRLRYLRHPHVLQMVEKFEDPEGVIIITEYCPGGDLLDHVVGQGPYSMRQASGTVRQILMGLTAIHAQGVIHRDIKPENCMFGITAGHPTLKIGDFGLALLCDSSSNTVKANLAGSPRYMSPEAIISSNFSAKSDVWAVGVILYALLSGSTPFNGMTHTQIFTAIKSGEFGFPGSAWGVVTDEAKDCIRALLQTRPDDRPSAKQALELPFIKASEQLSGQPLEQAYASFRKFTLKARFKAVAKVCIVAARQHQHYQQQAVAAAEGEGKEQQPPGALGQGSDNTSLMHEQTVVLPSDEEEEGVEAACELGALAFHGEHDLLNIQELSELTTVFKEVASTSTTQLDLKGFKRLMRRIGKDSYPLGRMFKLFDADGNGLIDYRELLLGLHKLKLQGEDAVQFLFDVVDEDGSGGITKEELAHFLIWSHHHHQHMQLKQQMQQEAAAAAAANTNNTNAVNKSNSIISNGSMSFSHQEEEAKEEEVVVGLPLDETRKVDLDPNGYRLSEIVAELFTVLDGQGSGLISREDFVHGYRTRPDLFHMLFKGGSSSSQKGEEQQQQEGVVVIDVADEETEEGGRGAVAAETTPTSTSTSFWSGYSLRSRQ